MLRNLTVLEVISELHKHKTTMLTIQIKKTIYTHGVKQIGFLIEILKKLIEVNLHVHYIKCSFISII